MTRTLKDIGENEAFTLAAWVKSKTLLTSKNGRDYLALRLVDKTGECDARIWDQVDELAQQFNANDFVTVSGRMVRHQGTLQAHVHSIATLTDDIDYTQFLPACANNPEGMYRELLALIATEVDNPHVRAVLSAIFEDPDVAERYKRAPAARSNHHAYLSGLLEHSLGLAKLGLSVLRHYPKIDKSIVLAGLLLHDIGKIYELSYKDGFNYTAPGKLIGHLVMGIELVTKKAQGLADFPEETLMLLKHTIAGHHGQIDYGSPVLPQTLEAIMVHFLDNMDSKLAAMQELLERDAATAGDWTAFDRMYGRTMYKTEAFRSPPSAASAIQPSGPAVEPVPAKAPGTPAKKTAANLTVSLGEKLGQWSKQD